MRKQTRELIELLRRAIAHAHKESDVEDIRGSRTRREMAKQLRGVRAAHTKFGTGRPLDMFRYVFKILDGLDPEFKISN
jgi:hypothetical protein